MDCQTVLKPASIYYHKNQDQSDHILCRTCYQGDDDEHLQIVPQCQQVEYPTKQLIHHPSMSPTSPLSFDNIPPVQPSDLLSSKKKHGSFQRFGTVKVCPGCQDRITSFHDERTGPRAAKWHRQCLVCCSCQKVLDSSAKVHQAPESDRLVPSCTTCLVSKRERET
ncbi:hypothetical protein BC941DRAFT_426803 [Chlamydoabsidia padenii]|nr:hypothetical protein BC941DRAFT_426803 [Chlamydoabsidia padenii]